MEIENIVNKLVGRCKGNWLIRLEFARRTKFLAKEGTRYIMSKSSPR